MSELIVPFTPGWIKNKDSLTLSDGLYEILKFYLWGTPCRFVSSCGKPINECGWGNDVWKKGNLRSYLLSIGNLQPRTTYKKVKNASDMTHDAASIGLGGSNFHSRIDCNRIVFLEKKNDPEILSIFYYIRCAFAHGRFEVHRNNANEVYYTMEAIKRKRGTKDYISKARMVLSEKTLLDWIRIVKEGETTLHKNIQKLNESIQTEIKSVIKSKTIKKADELAMILPYESEQINRQIRQLKQKKEIEYDQHDRGWKVKE